MPLLERLWKLQWRVASAGHLPVRVISLEAGFDKGGCLESGSGLSKWKEHCLSQHLSHRCQRSSKAAVGDELICTVPGQQVV